MDYPNLELLEYKTREIVNRKYGDKYKNADWICTVFCQTWPSTALGFGGFGGQAMTNAYTTVFESEMDDLYVVFFGGRPAYIVENPTDVFREDFARRSLKAVSEANCSY